MHNGQQKGRLVFFWLGEKIEHWPPRGTDCPDMYMHTREGDGEGEGEGEGEHEYLRAKVPRRSMGMGHWSWTVCE